MAKTEIMTRDEVETPPAPPPVPAATAIISVIERAALNPDVDIDKMERLLQMQQRIMAQEAKVLFDTALAEMQPELPVIDAKGAIKNKSGGVQSRYGKWEDVNEAIRPVLSAHGFALSFRIAEAENAHSSITGVLSHRAGHREETSIRLPADHSGSKNAVQAIGSAVSYGKRYTAFALLNITVRGEDDDGQAGGSKAITEAEFIEIRNMIEEAGADEDRFLKYLGVPNLEEMPRTKLDGARAALRKKINEAKKAKEGRADG